MPKGHGERFYRFKLYNVAEDNYIYFKECGDIKTTYGIPKASVYKMINNENNTCNKWNKYKIYSVKEPVFQRIQISY